MGDLSGEGESADSVTQEHDESERGFYRGDDRRAQLVSVICDIIERDGVDAVKHALVGREAGCARTLVYRYFPSRADMLEAVTADFYLRLEKRLEAAGTQLQDQQQVENDAASEFLIGAIFEQLEESGLAALLLRANALISTEYTHYQDRIYKRYEKTWLNAYLDLGLEESMLRSLLDNVVAIARNAVLAWFRGDLSRQEAVNMTIVQSQALASATIDFLAGGQGSNSK